MAKSNKIIFCVFMLINTSLYAENTTNLEEKNFFCCSIYDLYKTNSLGNEGASNVKNSPKVNKPTKIPKILKVKENKEIIKTSENKISYKSNINSIQSSQNEELIKVEADESYWNEKKQVTILQGDTKIIRGEETIKSELANFLQLENRARLSGAVQYTADGVEVKAPYAEYNTKEGRTDFISPKYKYPSLEISGKARYGVRLKNKKMFLKNSTYTTCDLINPDWNLISKSTELDFERGVGTGKDVFVSIKGVPVFYSPYMRFSLDDQRKTGFLVPNWSGSWSKGPDVSTPFYWNIAENMDMLIEPSYIQDKGSKIETTFRYLENKYDGQFYLSYLGDDSEYVDDRYRVLIDHEHRVNSNLSINTFYDKTSDKDYYKDFGTGIAGASKTYGSRYVESIYTYNDWRVYSKFLGYQVLDKSITSASEPYDILPKIEISKRWNRDLANFDINTSITNWDHNHKNKVDGTRSDFQFGIDKTFSMKGIEITPRLKLQHTQYNLNNQTAGFSSNPSKTIPILSVNSEMVFSKRLKESNLVHQIKPRLFYLYAEEENQDDIPTFDTSLNTFSYAQMFRDNRFSGRDRTSDANQLSVSISSNFYDMKDFRNIFNISFGKIIYFEDRKISTDNETIYTRTNSNLVAEMEYKPTENVSFISTFLYDTHADEQKTQYNNHTFQYRGKNNNIFNASYRYSKNSVAQGDMSFAWGVTDNLKLLGRWNYDFKNNPNNNNSGDDIETLAGLEYESCCWKVRLIQRRYKIGSEEYEKDLQFQIMLKGFTDVGTPLGDTIASSIKGYINKEY